jgi:hypothetical protein
MGWSLSGWGGFVRPEIGPHVDRSRGAIPGLAGSRRSPGECGPEQSAAFGGGEPCGARRAFREPILCGRDTTANRGVQRTIRSRLPAPELSVPMPGVSSRSPGDSAPGGKRGTRSGCLWTC